MEAVYFRHVLDSKVKGKNKVLRFRDFTVSLFLKVESMALKKGTSQRLFLKSGRKKQVH